MSARIFFWVQHLLGIGHLRRAASIARSLAAAGHEVLLVSGGVEVPGLEVAPAGFVQLPPVRAQDRLFKVLCHDDGRVIDEAFRAERRDLLLGHYHRFRPHLVLTEMFPFGRRQLRFELEPLMQAIAADAHRPAVVSSVRDILVQSPKPERLQEMLDSFERWFDLVLVHGDQRLIPFERTFPAAQRIAGRIAHTGYILDGQTRRAPQSSAGRGEVIVSAGGGAVGGPLLRAALAARARCSLAALPWRLLSGPNLPPDQFRALADEAERCGGVRIERARSDFIDLLANCTLSVSQAGYNTVIETLSFADRAVVVPYAGGLETEQGLRAGLLQQAGAFEVVPEQALDAATLAAAIDRRMAAPSIRTLPRCNIEGLQGTRAALEELLARRNAAGRR